MVAEDLGAVTLGLAPVALAATLEEVAILFFPISPKDFFPLLCALGAVAMESGD
jgi:hypothetical protein